MGRKKGDSGEEQLLEAGLVPAVVVENSEEMSRVSMAGGATTQRSSSDIFAAMRIRCRPDAKQRK